MALCNGPFLKFGYLVRQEILMAHRCHRNCAPAVGLEPFPHTLCVISRCIHYLFATDITLGRVYDPFALVTGHAGRGAKPFYASAHVAGPFCQGLGQLRRVYITVIGVI